MGQTPAITRGTFTPRVLAEASVMVALALVLNALRLYTLPQGGTITIGEMVPILFVALRRGPRVGVFAGAIFGIVDVYFEPFVYNPIQFLLDYPLAYGALGLAGFFRGRSPFYSGVGVAVAIGCRFVCHFSSGIIFFASFAPSGENPAIYSAIYNATYLLPGLLISEFVILVLARSGALKFRL
ncbi:MAG TPA: energy-coupled thiamine transporter ThiT [Nitrososphaerales archaeon]